MPRAPEKIGIATIPATSSVSSCVSLFGIALSSTSRNRNGETIPTPDETRISASSASSWRRYGLNSRTTRPTGGAPVPALGRPGSSDKSRLNVPLAKRRRRGCGLERQVQNLSDGHHRVEVHLLPDVLGEAVQVGTVAPG